jgi:hypothetical protein
LDFADSIKFHENSSSGNRIDTSGQREREREREMDRWKIDIWIDGWMDKWIYGWMGR